MATYKVIVQGGYMSGDMFGVAAAMILDDKVCVNIVRGTGEEYLAIMDDQTDRLTAFYKEILGDEQFNRRVAVGTIEDPQAYIKSITGEGGRMDQSQAEDIKGFFSSMGGSDTVVLHRIGMATDIVSKTFNWGRVVDRFLRDELQGNIKVFLEGGRFRKLLDFYAPRVFLWVRINKRKPKATAHLELDTSVQGLRQLTERIAAENAERKRAGIPEWIIALTGDRIDLNLTKNKVLKDNCVDMMEFWNAPGWNKAWGRCGQLTAFAWLYGRNAKMVNLGMRSGGLEGPALLGIPTIYMEEEDNPQRARMEKWVGPVRLASGPSSYFRLGLSQLPTRTGQAIKASTGMNDPSAVARLLDQETREDAGTNRDRLAAAKVEYHRQRGSSFGDFFGIYVSLAGTLWRRLDSNALNWRQYSTRNPVSSGAIKRRVGQWYGLRVEKAGSTGRGGFASDDVDAIMTKLTELLPDPPRVEEEEDIVEEVVREPPSISITPTLVTPPVSTPTVVSTPPPSSGGSSSTLRPPVPLGEMGTQGRRRWIKKLRTAGLNPQDFY